MVHMVRNEKTSPRASGPLGLHSDAGASHCEVRASRSLSFTHSLNSRSDMSKYTILSRGFTLATAAALLCVASDLTFTPGGVIPGRLGRSHSGRRGAA